VKARVFTLPLGADGVFDDGPVRAFFEAHDGLAITEHFFTHDGIPTLTLVVQYRAPVAHPIGTDARADGRRGATRDDVRMEVLPEHQPLMEALRIWRNARARQEGKPAYVLFTNAQLATIAAARPASRAQLAAVDGIGEARVRDYADEVLGLVQRMGAEAAGGSVVPDTTGGT
jgi:superfamily II DNA helicase RecQ